MLIIIITIIILNMSFQSKFKGKASLVGKEGTMASINNTLPFSEHEHPKSHQQNTQIVLPPKHIAKSSSEYLQVHSQNSTQNNHSNLLLAGYNHIHPNHKLADNTPIVSNLPKGNSFSQLPTQQVTVTKMLNQLPYPNTDIRKSHKYITLGGLGPNTGTVEWIEKASRKSEMLKFALNVNNYNKEKLSSAPKRNETQAKVDDGRWRAMEYSRQLQKMLHSSNPIINHPINIEKDLQELNEMKVKCINKLEG